MSIKCFNQDEGVKLLAQMINEGKLIPVIGSGFTKGCPSFDDTVPDGSQTTQIMKRIIAEANSVNLEDADFNKVSERFFSLVSEERRWVFFQKYFTHVKIDGYRKDFLLLPWPYVYTLNVDDGIERTGIFTPLLPYKDAKSPNTSIKLVIKLHGDAMYEVLYKHKKNIVFSLNQYIETLTSPDNQTICNFFSADYKQNNLLYIGCSLTNEPDLKYVYSKCKDDISENVLRCVIRSRKPSLEEELDLQGYGINAVILVADYELFYRELIKAYNDISAQRESTNYPFVNPRYVRIPKKEKDNNLYYFSGKNIFDESKNAFYISQLFVMRSCMSEIERVLEKEDSVIIRGRRFCGKTILLSLISERFQKYTSVFFPSDTTIDEDVLVDLLENNKNTIFLFDSNSLTDHAYHQVANAGAKLKINGNKMVVAINSNDVYLADSLNAEMILIPSVFDDSECERINTTADEYGLIRKRSRITNIDYLKRLSDIQKISLNIFDLPKEFSQNEQAVLTLLCIKDKLYYSEISALGVRYQEIDDLIERMQGIVEKAPVSKREKYRHSTQKLVHNSKYYLLWIMRGLTHEQIINTIRYIVSKLSPDSTCRRLYVETVLFDTLNQLFGHTKGAGELIFKIYDALSESLNQDMDYWLQRAKSVYRIRPNSYKDLLDAYQYAKKAAEDGNLRLKAKSALTLSLICCLLSKVCKGSDEKEGYEIEAISCADEAISSEVFKLNPLNFKGELGINTRAPYPQLIIDTCNKHMDSTNDISIAWKAIQVKKKIQEMADDGI